MPWISPMDYPDAIERRKPGGIVEAECTTGGDGRMTACRIVASSGNALLDQRTCWLSQRRARARPGEPRVQVKQHLWIAP
jgi:protein TonB